MHEFKKIVFLVLFYASFALSMDKVTFRDYGQAKPHVKDFYSAQHKYQTLDFVKDQIAQLKAAKKEGPKRLCSIWDALLELDLIVDDSDPDTSLPNSVHALQTAEAIRADLDSIAQLMKVKKESIDWLPLVGLLHDLGKFELRLRRMPQWAVVGDTFPVGCQFSKENIFYDDFKANSDFDCEQYCTELGIYKNALGLNKLFMAYGHDEYAYRVFKKESSLPKEALYIIRFHSFYPLHDKDAYTHLLREEDKKIVEWLKIFRRYDLYSKHDDNPSREALAPYYKILINKYFAPKNDEQMKLLSWPILKDIIETK